MQRRTNLALILLAFILPIPFPGGGCIMQQLVFRTNHAVVILVIHIVPPRQSVFFGHRTFVSGGKNSSTVEDSFADPGCFVGAVCHHGFVFWVLLAKPVIKWVKGYAVMDISGGYFYF